MWIHAAICIPRAAQNAVQLSPHHTEQCDELSSSLKGWYKKVASQSVVYNFPVNYCISFSAQIINHSIVLSPEGCMVEGNIAMLGMIELDCCGNTFGAIWCNLQNGEQLLLVGLLETFYNIY